jgi:Ca2+-binding RTX toxin-like protein
MTVSYLTKTELGKEDGVKNLDTDVKKALLNALYADGIYYHSGDPHETAVFQDDGLPVTPITQILELDTNATVDTNPLLKAIIMDDAAGGPHGGDGHARDLTVTGSSAGNSIFVAMGNAGDTVTLQDSGNDTVYGGGHARIDATQNTGNDSLVGYGGYDTIYGGSGQDTLIGSGGHDTLVAGTGTHQSLQGAGGNDSISHNSLPGSPPTYDTLIGSGGNDTITGQQGDYLQETGNKGSQFWLSGTTGASSTLQGGKGDDTFHIETTNGSDTITGGGGHDVVDIDRSINDLKPGAAGFQYDNHTGVTTLTFQGGQTLHLSGISEVHFTNNDSLTLKP